MHVDVGNWVRETARKCRTDGLKGMAWGLYHLYLGGWLTVTSRWPVGTNVFDRDWDVLVVLDACRVDAIRAVAGEFDFIDTVDSIPSVGSTSSEWMLGTFRREHLEEIRGTAYVSGNLFTDRIFVEGQRPPTTETFSIDYPVPLSFPRWNVVDESDFERLDKVWEYVDERGSGGFPPRPITDRAISVARQDGHDRMIIHYMQPHTPFIADGVPSRLKDRSDVLVGLRNGEFSLSAVREAYLANLSFVLEEVDLLLDNLDAERVVITSDHGEAWGELWGYGHTYGWPHPAVRRVPWVETSARDTGTYEPELDTRRTTDVDVEARLQDLGYL